MGTCFSQALPPSSLRYKDPLRLLAYISPRGLSGWVLTTHMAVPGAVDGDMLFQVSPVSVQHNCLGYLHDNRGIMIIQMSRLWLVSPGFQSTSADSSHVGVPLLEPLW